jgi:cytochrome c553
MKIRLGLAVAIFAAFVIFTAQSHLQTTTAKGISGTIPDVIVLAEKAAIGKVTFNHANHALKEQGGVAAPKCVTCHHAEQPLAEATKDPLHKTVYPADRTVTLTAETLKDAATPKVTACRDCHARKDETPKLLKEIPQIKEGEKVTVMTNQNAFHRNCASCHDQMVKANPALKAPKTMQCMVCHKKG